MKEKGIRMVFLPLALWLMFTLCALPALAAEAEMAIAENLSARQMGELEWIALAFASVWALIMQIFRLRK